MQVAMGIYCCECKIKGGHTMATVHALATVVERALHNHDLSGCGWLVLFFVFHTFLSISRVLLTSTD